MDKSGGVSGKLMERNRKMQQDAFALVAYPNPWESPLGWQLAPSEREQVCLQNIPPPLKVNLSALCNVFGTGFLAGLFSADFGQFIFRSLEFRL